MKTHVRDRLFLLLGLGIFAGLSLASAWREAATPDEPVHLTAGYLYWHTGRYFTDPDNPPLLQLWTSAPAALLSQGFSWPPPPWVIQNRVSLSDYFLYFNTVPAGINLMAARAMMIVLGILLGYLVWQWSMELFGREAALASLTAYAFCPPLLAYSHLVTQDFGHTCFFFLSLYAFWHYWSHPTVRTAGLAGLSMGLSLASKFSGLLALPIMAAIAISTPSSKSPHRHKASRLLAEGTLYALTVFLVVAVSYRFQLPRLMQQLASLGRVMEIPRDPHFFMGSIRDSGHGPGSRPFAFC